ncbi:MAG: ATP-binding protein [Candidatus Nitrotoga sp.]
MNRWFDVYAFRIGQPEERKVVILFNNITEKKLAEEELHESRERLKFTLEAAKIGEWDLDLITGKATRSFLHDKCFGADKPFEDWSYEKFLTYVHPDDLVEIQHDFGQALKEQKEWHFQTRIVWANNSVHWIEGHGNVYRTNENKPIRMIGIVADITEKKRAELNLGFLAEISLELVHVSDFDEITKKMASRIGKHFGVANCMFAEIDTIANTARIDTLWKKNDSAVDFSGFYQLSDFITDDVRQTLLANIPIIINDIAEDARTAEKAENFQKLKIGSFINTPFVSKGELKFILDIYRHEKYEWRVDEIQLLGELITRIWTRIERARGEKEREKLLASEQEARQQAERANNLKDEFLATLSHELRTPLNAILGWSQILKMGKFEATDFQTALTTIERSAWAQNQLIDDLLDVSRIITGKLRLDVRAVDMLSVIEMSVDSVRPAAEAKNIRLHVLLDPNAGPISGDPDRLQQVIWNLLSNAVKFTPKGGYVQVRLERINSHIEIVISDTGKGIAPEFLPQIFVRFQQFDGSMTRRHGGLGLGLAIVRQLTELHGGTVSVKSGGKNQGATFTVSLPLLPVRHEDFGNVSRVHPSAENANSSSLDCTPELTDLRVLLVEDEADSRILMNFILNECGAEVTAVASAAEALVTFKTEKFDVVVSDIGMPEEDGFTLISKIRKLPDESGGNVPAIALTAYARAEDRVRALRSGFQIHIAKPVKPAELIAVIANLGGKIRNPRFIPAPDKAADGSLA